MSTYVPVRTYVMVRVAAEAYAIPVGYVAEVAPPGPVTRVPGARPEVTGVRNMRGTIMPVVDLALLLGLPATGPRARLLVAQDRGFLAGFEIDQVQAVRDLAEPTQDAGSALLAGALLADGELVGVIDMPEVFGELSARAP